MGNEVYIWRVTLEGRHVEVKGRDKLEATQKAAKELGVRWSKTARDMDVMRLRRRQRAPEREEMGERQRGKNKRESGKRS